MIRESNTPLLNDDALSHHTDIVDDELEYCDGDSKLNMKEELSKWFHLVWPAAITLLCRTGMDLTDVIVIGHLGSDYLYSISMSTIWCSLSFIIVWGGAIDALNTLCSQAWGAKQYELVGIWYHFGLIFSLALCIPIALSWIFAGDLFSHLVKMKKEQITQVNNICRVTIIGLPFMTAYGAINYWLQSQHIVIPQLCINVFSLVLNICLNYFFVNGIGNWEGFGYIGSPIASAITRIIVFMTIWYYVYIFKKIHLKTCPPETYQLRNIFRRDRAKSYFGQAVPLMISSALENWQIQVVSMFAATLGRSALDTHNGMFQIFMFMTSIVWAFMDGTRVRMSQHLGHGSIKGAKMVLRISCYTCGTFAVTVATIIFLTRTEISHIFINSKDSNAEEISKLTQSVASLVGIGYAALSIFFVSVSALTAQGRPHLIAVAFFIGAWGIGVPCSYWGLKHFPEGKQLQGIWTGIIAGYGTVTSLALFFLCKTDWQAAVDLAKKTNEVEPLEETNVLADPLLDSHTLAPLQ